MSIVTYENVDTPVFEIDYLRYLFTDGTQGLWLPYRPDHLYADVDKTVPAVFGGGIASFDDLSGNGVTGPQPTSTARPILGRVPRTGRRNLLTWTEDFSNPAWSGNYNVTPNAGVAPDGTETLALFNGLSNLGMDVPVVPSETYTLTLWAALATATRHVVRFYDVTNAVFITGNINSGASSTLSRRKVSVTVPAGCTAMRAQIVRAPGGGETDGSVYIWGAQLEKGADETPYQRVTNEYDVTEAGIPYNYYARYDSADDVLPKDATLAAITDGTVILIGQQGIWIDEGYSFAGGNWSLGPTTYPNGPEGIIGVVGDMLDLVVLDRPLTPQERQKVIQAGVRRGSAGLIELGPELVVNGTFDENIDGWEPSHPDGRVTLSWDDGAIRAVGPSEIGGAQQMGLDLSDVFVVVEGTLVSAGNSSRIRLNVGSATGAIRFESRSSSVAGDRIRSITYLTAAPLTTAIYLRGDIPPYDIKWDNISVRKLILPGEAP